MTLDGKSANSDTAFAPTNGDNKKYFFRYLGGGGRHTSRDEGQSRHHHGHQVHLPGGGHRAYPPGDQQPKHPLQLRILRESKVITIGRCDSCLDDVKEKVYNLDLCQKIDRFVRKLVCYGFDAEFAGLFLGR